MGGLYCVALEKMNPFETVACGSANHKAYLLSIDQALNDATCQSQVLDHHTGEVNSLDFHDEQKVMVSVSDDGRALVYDYSQPIQLRELKGHTKEVYGVKVFGGKTQS